MANNSLTSSGIIYRVATVHDYDEILDFLRIHYYPEESITIGNEPKTHTDEDEQFTMETIHLGTSIIAINEQDNGKLVGACISGPIDENDANHMIKQSKVCKSKKWSEILQLFAHLENTANICKRFNVTQSLHMHVLAVDVNLRGKSIGAKLLNTCMQNAKSMGFPIASCDCTSIYSIKLAERLNMKCIAELAFVDYKDSNGRQIFKPPLPHTHIKTFVKLL